MSLNTTTTMREPLPDGVVEDILGHLPVKSLTRFRCVSKTCDSIITDPTFITKHFKLNLKQSESLKSTNNHSGYLLYTTKDKNSSSSSKQLCTVAFNNDRTLSQVSRFEIPSFFDKCKILGCCNGLFCLANYEKELCDIIYLWNPSIRMFKKLVATPFTVAGNTCVIGLAYNSQNNDFKILRLVSFFWEQEAEAEIYSLSTDSWRKVVISMESLRGYEPNFGRIRFVDIDAPCIFFNGALHHVAMANCHRFILSFDVNNESFREIMFPEIMFPPNPLVAVTEFTQLALFKGSLALLASTHSCGGAFWHIWVMEEYGVAEPESWTRKYTVPMISNGHFYGCTDSGEVLLKKATGLVSINPESRRQNILVFEDVDWVGFTANSMESLILLDGKAEAEIYSLSTDSWRKVVISMESLRRYEPNFGTIVDIGRACIFFNGALHTVADTNHHSFILSFNVNDEIFREIMLPPNYLDGVPVFSTDPVVFKGSLAVFFFAYDDVDVFCYIWVMEEYGVAESWTRKYMVPMMWISFFYGCTDNGELLIESGSALVSIDPESQNQNILAIEDADWMGFTANSMESLILLDGGMSDIGLES